MQERLSMAGITVSAFTSSRKDPSSRFRMRQFFPTLRTQGIQVSEHCPLVSKYSPAWVQVSGLPLLSRLPGLLASRGHRISWLNRELVSGWAGWERFAGGVRLLDIDDALWVPHGERFIKKLVGGCHGIIAANEILAARLRQWHDRVWVVPSCIDVERWCPAPSVPCSQVEQPWTLGWSGTAWNLPYLYGIAPALGQFLRSTVGTRLLVVCDRPPRLPDLPADRWQYLPWSEESEVRALRHMDVGLMPLPDDEWTRGKSAFKLLAYLAVGLPVIASPVGLAAEILTRAQCGQAAVSHDAWVAKLFGAWEERHSAIPATGRQFVVDNYALKVGVRKLADIFAQALSR